PMTPTSAASATADDAASAANTSSSTDSTSAPSILSPGSVVRRLPIPTPSANHSQTSITFVDVQDTADPNGDFDGLPPEVASADISIAPDGSFVETSSGQAAHELKKRYDRMLGVSVHNPSPFAITAFTNQHGRPMFRVGYVPPAVVLPVHALTRRHRRHRQAIPPGRTAEESVSDRRSPRRSRLSMNAFLPPAIFPSNTTYFPTNTIRVPEPTPPPQTSKDGARSPTTRRLRKTRSNPQLSAQSPSLAQEASAQPTHTGRGHSQSVTAADLPRFSTTMIAAPPPKPVLRVDLFSEVMHWPSHVPPSPSNSSSASYSSSSTLDTRSERSGTHGCLLSVIPNPFGPRVMFDSPSKPAVPHLHVPVIREMQSFESGLTARADPVPHSASAQRATFLSQASVSAGKDSPTPSEAPSAPPTPSLPATPFTPRPGSIDRGYTPTMETLMYTQYSTEVFDVLQTYRGLPLLEKLLPDSTETTVIKMSLTADERATPRDDPRFVIWGDVMPEPGPLAPDARTDGASTRSGRRSTKGSDDRPNLDGGSAADGAVAEPEKLLLAATIERWIAQLTSELNYDELLVFFMTYRLYIRPVDLCHLLICRFHWALGMHANEHDETVRRIVRVRTFVAMRYWLLTFFEVDFLPNRELRLLIAGWLNALKKDPILQKHHDASGIVRKLVSVVRECKEVHSQRIRPSAPVSRPSISSPPPSTPSSPPAKIHPLVALFGKSFEGYPVKGLTLNDSDIDLDFVPGDEEPYADSVLQQPLHRAIMEHRPSISATPLPLPITPATLPMHQNILSRAFVNTIGRLGRWKRVNSRPVAFNSRHASSTPIAVCGDVSAFDLELNETDDLLTVRGGVEQYLKMLEMDAHEAAPVFNQAEIEIPTSPQSDGSHPVHVSLDPSIRSSSRASSSSSSSYGQVFRSRYPHSASGSSRHNPWGVDVISIDDLDLSDDDEASGDLSSPPGLGAPKPPRRLPLRRDFEFVDRIRGSVSSMGLTSARNSVSTVASSRASGEPVSGGLGTAIHQWQVDALVDSLSDDEEAGDVENALRRLEGNLNPQRQREKSSKVDNWVKTIRERLEAGDYGQPLDAPRDSTEGGDGQGSRRSSVAWSVHTAGESSAQSSPRSARRIMPQHLTGTEANESATPVLAQTPYTVPLPPDRDHPEVDPAVPEEILKSRLSTSTMTMPLKFASPSALPHVHRSWVLNHSSSELAEHFAMIDKELFLEVKFEEMIGDEWKGAVDETNVLDWGAYLQDRARWKAERRAGWKTSGLTTVRARFNLVACFVQSEIVLTPPSSRHVLVGKFIRIAWKCYSLNNYSTLVAIIAGLRSDWVTRAMHKLWNRVNVYNLRMLNDLSSFASSEDDFAHVQIAVRTLEEAKAGGNDEASSTKGSATKGGKETPPAAGVPFVGIYLSQLHRYSHLPDLIDPTAPNEAVGIDRSTNNFQTLAHPEVFSTLAPLPPSMQLEPLVNVHKQRLIAGTIKSLVAGQHLASRVAFPVDKKLFQRCLKLRGLGQDMLQRAQAMY
ncbi:hypothetical protein K488DRAFT_26430, partial [Vararia minispora EC-137]